MHKSIIISLKISHKDRFVRFGYDWFYRFCEKFNKEILFVNMKNK